MHKAGKILLRYEALALMRNRFQLLMLGLTFLFGLYAIYYGQAEIEAQRHTLQALNQLEEDEFRKYQASFTESLVSTDAQQNHDIASKPSFAWFRHGYHAVLPPHDYAALAIGQRDLFRYYYRLTGMSLYYQLFENELANPQNLLAGNFDLSFVIVYLFPLLIIAFCYGLYSGEKELGTLPLLHIQAVSIRFMLLVRLGFYFALIGGLVLMLSLIGLLSSGKLLQEQNFLPALAWLLGSLLYCAFWFALMFFIISFYKNSSFNAIAGAGCWLLFLIVVPAVLNVLLTTQYPLSSTQLADLTRRTGLENEEDEAETREVIVEYLAHNPQFAGSDSLMHNHRMAKAYAAFTSLKDIKSRHLVDAYNRQVLRRKQWSDQFLGINPAVNMQELFSHLAQTDLTTFLAYQEALSRFHGQIKDFYFSRLFWDKPLRLEDYAQRPVFALRSPAHNWTAVLRGMLQIGMGATIMFILGFFKMREGVKA